MRLRPISVLTNHRPHLVFSLLQNRLCFRLCFRLFHGLSYHLCLLPFPRHPFPVHGIRLRLDLSLAPFGTRRAM